MGRRPAATGDSAPTGGWSSGMHPPFSFPSCGKENRPCTVQKKRPLRRAPARSRLCATGVGGSVQAPILACLRARYHLLQFLGLPSRGGWCGGRRGGYRIVSASLFAAAGRPARELVQRADVGIRPYGEAGPGPSVGADLCVGSCGSANPSVGADALIRPKA